jgi:hypothetical protein
MKKAAPVYYVRGSAYHYTFPGEYGIRKLS